MNMDQDRVGQGGRHDAGATLIELAMAISIGGLLWGGVLLVQSLIDRATAHTLIQEMVNVKTMLYTYRDRYGAVPGDDSRAAQHVPGGVNATGGMAAKAFSDDGMISSGLHYWTNQHSFLVNQPVSWLQTPEPALFWNHVRSARLFPGDPLEYPVYNAVQGYLGIGDDGPGSPPGVGGKYKVCSSAIDGRIARAMDASFDDGDAMSGTMFAAVEINGEPVTQGRDAPNPYINGSTYTVCMRF